MVKNLWNFIIKLKLKTALSWYQLLDKRWRGARGPESENCFQNVCDDWWLECREVHPSASSYALNYWESVNKSQDVKFHMSVQSIQLKTIGPMAEQVKSIVKTVWRTSILHTNHQPPGCSNYLMITIFSITWIILK